MCSFVVLSKCLLPFSGVQPVDPLTSSKLLFLLTAARDVVPEHPSRSAIQSHSNPLLAVNPPDCQDAVARWVMLTRPLSACTCDVTMQKRKTRCAAAPLAHVHSDWIYCSAALQLSQHPEILPLIMFSLKKEEGKPLLILQLVSLFFLSHPLTLIFCVT